MGDEHLPPHALSRTLVERIGNDADDLDRQLGFWPDALPEVLADRARALEEVFGESPVDDRDLRILLEVQSREVAALEERNLIVLK